jgi:hypothetical protein
VEGWQKKYDLIDNHFILLGWYLERQIKSMDLETGRRTESNTEKEKGEASDAFKELV